VATPPPLPFLFVDSPAEFSDDAALVVRVPAGVRSKQKLLAILADKLHFPGYFGWNWDALEECLGDLSWLPQGQRVAIVHDDLPFGSGGDNRAVYQNILASVAQGGAGGHPLRIVFPAANPS
jgi:hypothetical protein